MQSSARRMSVLFVTSVGTVLLIVTGLWLFSLRVPETQTDIFVYGSSLGGLSAAITAADSGARVVIATDSSVIGGQAVEAGLSAFDDQHQLWQRTGLYGELITYLEQKYDKFHPLRAGLGQAVVGEIASTPDDIQEFFLWRIRQNPRISLLTEQTFVSVDSSNDHFVRATLRDQKTGQERFVRFAFLVDGTETGRVLQKTNTPFALGLDAKEETGEPDILTRDQRSCLINGCSIDGNIVRGLGNRVQPVTMPIALLDRGYPGDFYPFPAPGDSGCWQPSTASGFMVRLPVWEAQSTGCESALKITPDFDDTYDVYFIHHRGFALSAEISSPQASASSLHIERLMSRDEQFVKVGSFFAGPKSPLVFTTTALALPFDIEGVILIRKNMHEASTTLQFNVAGESHYERQGLPFIRGDVYFSLTNAVKTGTMNGIVDGVSFIARRVGNRTFLASDIPLRERGMFSLQSSESQVTGATVIPVQPDLHAALVLDGDTPDRTIAHDPSPPTKEWTFVAPTKGLYFFAGDALSAQWVSFEIEDLEQHQSIVSVSTIPVTRNIFPLAMARLEEGRKYVVRISVSSQWETFHVSVIDVARSNILWSNQDSRTTIKGGPFAGIYDLWVRAPAMSQIALTSIRGDAQEPLPTVTTEQSGPLEYAGKAYLDSQTMLQAAAPVTVILAIPTVHVDTYSVPLSAGESQMDISLTQLPPGIFRASVINHVVLSSAFAVVTTDLPSSTQAFSLASSARLQPQKRSFTSTGGPLKLRLPYIESLRSASLLLYEDIPSLANASSFSLRSNPLLAPLPSRSDISTFSFRNIIAGSALKQQNFFPFSVPVLGENTQGVTIVINPSNDKKLSTDEIDSVALAEQARALTLSYDYWSRYDAPLTFDSLGCSPETFLCDPGRIVPVVGLFADRLSLFPPHPYYREGRRALTKTIMREQDFLIPVHPCDSSICAGSGCTAINTAKGFCMDLHHKDFSPDDGLLATSYPIDMHMLYSKEEMQKIIDAYLSVLDRSTFNLPFPFSYPFVHSMFVPAPVRLGSFLVRNGANIFPASLNIGATQLANGALRIHYNEMAVGQSLGFLLGYCIQNHCSPDALTGEQLLSLRRLIIERGATLFPLVNTILDPIVYKEIQLLLLERRITMHLRTNFLSPREQSQLFFYVDYIEPLNQEDANIIAWAFHIPPTQSLTYRTLFQLLHLAPDSADDTLLLRAGKDSGFLSHYSALANKTSVLNEMVQKADLYRAVYLFQHPSSAFSSLSSAQMSTAPDVSQ